MVTGRKSAVGASAVQITSAVTHCQDGVQLKAADTNTGIVYVGASTVTANAADATDGFPLSAGQGLFVPITDASLIYVIASAAAQSVFWTVV